MLLAALGGMTRTAPEANHDFHSASSEPPGPAARPLLPVKVPGVELATLLAARQYSFSEYENHILSRQPRIMFNSAGLLNRVGLLRSFRRNGMS